ncbi:MerR family transcriptional regulator [Bacillus sp. USDA818B3_A]|uniref:MerR family transcriptional regulator n=1 Tax=Bacillus sp. USDA818B3_A TaxID=2698834 RepID=UPI0013684CB4|nr:MerR family transcriptional regulator [Bacillus sp. USDA818B3_A]
MKEHFTIGEVSKLFQVKIATLRYYDEIGLLRPEFTDEKTNYRYYSTQQFERLNSIKYLRALDLPISKIIDFFNYREIDTLVEMLKKQQAEVVKKKRELEVIETKLSSRLSQIEDAINSPLDKISEVRLPEMRVAYLRREYVLGDDIELPITELRNSLGMNGEIFLGKIGISISIPNLNNNVFDKYSSVFMVLEEGDEITPSTVTIPPRDYLRIRFKGTHMDAADYYKKLLAHMKERHYELIDDSIEITLIDYGITNDIDKYVTELLLPYTNK